MGLKKHRWFQIHRWLGNGVDNASFNLSADAQFSNDLFVTFEIVLLHIVQKLTTSTGHLNEAPTGVKILTVLLKVLR